MGISVSPSAEAERLGYDERQINRIVIRMARYFLDRDMRVIFGHDWREDGVMRAVADFAGVVAGRAEALAGSDADFSGSTASTDVPAARMVNVVAAARDALSGAALEAERDSGGVLSVLAAGEVATAIWEHWGSEMKAQGWVARRGRSAELTRLRHCLTIMLSPGCRVCLGGRTEGYQGNEPGVMEEARLALTYRKPLYLMGGFGGATRLFGADPGHGGEPYWKANNGLSRKEKRELFETTDVEWALGLISHGIESQEQRTRDLS
ncbi:MAG: hypothetical protein F4Y86_06520 [Gammaproteobacteria bacterium]|nr:hypothetical protein [Gammaproteobacteria bacterium]MYB38378.1 hypothetical protein [Gammaproteobacteria bacterium]